MRLTVLSVAYPFAPVGVHAVGGAEQVLSAIDRYLHREGHRSLVLGCEGSTAYGELYTVPLPEGVLDEARRSELRARYRERLEALLATHHVDVVHMHGVDFADYVPRVEVPTLVSLHLPLSFYRPGALASLPPHVHLCCVSSVQRSGGTLGLSLLPDVENGVDLEVYRPHPRPGDYALMLSRLCPEKGVHLGLEAARAAGLPARVAGKVFSYADHERYFEQQVAPLLDADRVFLGSVALPEKAKLLARARCLMVPSLVDETSSLVSMEALACGTPVVAYWRGALPHVIENGVTGFLAYDVASLTEALRKVHTIDRKRCREAALARFSEREMCARYLQRYRTITSVRELRRPHCELEELRTREALEALTPEWLALWQRCRDSTVFQRPEWLFRVRSTWLYG